MVRIGQEARDVQDLLTSPDTYGTVLACVAIDAYGLEALNWDPRTLRMELEASYGVEMSDASLDRLQAFLTAITTDQFYNDLWAFLHIANALNGRPVDFRVGPDEVDIEEIVWAVAEVGLSDPKEDDKDTPTYSEDVAEAVGVLLHREGFIQPPSVLSWAIMPNRPVSKDQETEAAVISRSQEQQAEMDQYLRERMQELFVQLKSSPFAPEDPVDDESSPSAEQPPGTGGSDFLSTLHGLVRRTPRVGL